MRWPKVTQFRPPQILFPPMLLQVGTDETLLWDTLLIADRARRAGVRVDLDVGPDLVHVYQLFTWCLPEALEALDRIAQFVVRHTGVEQLRSAPR